MDKETIENIEFFMKIIPYIIAIIGSIIVGFIKIFKTLLLKNPDKYSGNLYRLFSKISPATIKLIEMEKKLDNILIELDKNKTTNQKIISFMLEKTDNFDFFITDIFNTLRKHIKNFTYKVLTALIVIEEYKKELLSKLSENNINIENINNIIKINKDTFWYLVMGINTLKTDIINDLYWLDKIDNLKNILLFGSEEGYDENNGYIRICENYLYRLKSILLNNGGISNQLRLIISDLITTIILLNSQISLDFNIKLIYNFNEDLKDIVGLIKKTDPDFRLENFKNIN